KLAWAELCRRDKLRFAVGCEVRQAGRHLLHETAHRAVALLAGGPVLAGEDEQRAETARRLMEVAQLLVDRLGIADGVDTQLDQVVEGQVLDRLAQLVRLHDELEQAARLL